jgi:hypothetical protein
MSASDRDAARACAFVLGSGIVVLLLADTFEFSWRYQLPAVVTLPPAGALGLLVIARYLRGLRSSRTAESRLVRQAGPVPDVALAETVAGPPNGSAAPNGKNAKNGTGVPNVTAAEDGTGSDNGTGAQDGTGSESREAQGKDHASAG